MAVKINFSVRLDADEYEFLSALADRENRSIAGQIRHLIAAERARQKMLQAAE